MARERALRESRILSLITDFAWSRTFYIVPLLLPILVLLFMRFFRRSKLDLKTGILAWSIAAPAGFLVWLLTWKTFGAATGQVAPTVVCVTLLSWWMLHRGVYVAWIQRRHRLGYAMSFAALAALVTGTAALPSGGAPIRLALIAGAVGLAIPVTVYLWRESCRLCCYLRRSYGVPLWKFLNQPVALR